MGTIYQDPWDPGKKETLFSESGKKFKKSGNIFRTGA